MSKLNWIFFVEIHAFIYHIDDNNHTLITTKNNIFYALSDTKKLVSASLRDYESSPISQSRAVL
jgi:hypothetical protein